MASVVTEPLRGLLRVAFPDATELAIIDRTGGGDHFQVTIAAGASRVCPSSTSAGSYTTRSQPRSRTAQFASCASRRKEPRDPLRDQISEIIETQPVALFMKGTPSFVACGNSQRALVALRTAGAPVTAVDILPDPSFRQELSAVSGWPTIPQVFVKGELVGGADIVEELAATGELERRLTEALGEGFSDAREERVMALAAA